MSFSSDNFKFHQYTHKSIENLNIELTSKCALGCQRCARTLHKGTYRITDIPLNLIKKRLHSDMLRNLDFIDLSGNYGDPIYYKDFFKALEFFKSNNCKVYIETNASGKDKIFWEQTVSILDSADIITFSVDGLEDTNSIYRMNAKWNDIQQAMKIVSASPIQAHWKFIVFKHNQHQIKKAKELSQDIGVSRFILVKSALFGEGFYNSEGMDPLMPEEKWVKSSSKNNQGNKQINSAKIHPKCLVNGMHYISAEGYYFPCCWIGHYHIAKTLFSENEMQSLSLHKYSLEEIFQSDVLKKLEYSWENIATAPQECINKCQWTGSLMDKSRSFHERIKVIDS